MANSLYSGRKQFGRPSGNDGVRADEQGRSEFRKDYARLLHAPSFRRLQGKTQLFPGGQSDYFRNRLTHSLEVAQIARGIAARLNATEIGSVFEKAAINEDLVEFASIAHDLGHPPFGHNGEHALDDLMKAHGGFEGNAQTLRILAHVERKLVSVGGQPSSGFGLDLTYRSLASVLKYNYCIPDERTESEGLKKGYYRSEAELVREIKKRVAPKRRLDQPFKTIECAIMDIADDIAYSTYDLEDSLHAGFYTPFSLANELANNLSIQNSVIAKTNKALQSEGYEKIKDVAEALKIVAGVFDVKLSQRAEDFIKVAGPRDEQSAALLVGIESHVFNRSLADNGLVRTKLTAERVGKLIEAVDLVPDEEFPQLSGVRLRRRELLQVEMMKHLNYELVVRSPKLAVVEHRGKDIVKQIFNALVESQGALLPTDWRQRYLESSEAGGSVRRVVCDFVACMTDRYAMEFYARLFGDESTIYKPI